MDTTIEEDRSFWTHDIADKDRVLLSIINVYIQGIKYATMLGLDTNIIPGDNPIWVVIIFDNLSHPATSVVSREHMKSFQIPCW